MTENDHITTLNLDDSGLPPPAPEVEQERRIAIFDLLEVNRFGVPGREGRRLAGPFRLDLSVQGPRLVFDVHAADGERATFGLSLSPFRQIIRDYHQICDAYFDAVKHLPPSRIEAIDMGRRGIHNEGSHLLMDRLEGKIDTDMATARRLFTLICVLHADG
jgi:uncharacterized protein (UPF0262 family)